ncbi:sensory neuron membrane protein 1-like [Condylostylus longicornis]|uniref:sensory neuron membrane protein 1-like n=1 Tax=Condylostylus longicornis TaxID=2530218 RepID=UPI00244E5A6B|nr:sensory neuron membrane protein 1-like [Condylostylus longicornis]
MDKKIAIICGVAFAYGIIFGFFIIPQVINLLIRFQTRLKPGNEARDIYNAIPFPLHFHIYVFNITNPEEFSNGGKPKLQEIGPYYFDEWKDKINQEDDEVEDTITFDMRNTWIFRPDLSNGLTGEEMITMAHPLVEMIALYVKKTRPPMIALVAEGLKELFYDNFNATYTGKFMDLFFRGIPIDCATDSFNAKAICSALHGGVAKNIVPYDKTTFLFSFLSFLNHSSAGRFTVCRGIKNIHKLGKVIKFNDETEFDAWDGEHCNRFHGTDTTVFPPFMTPEQGVWGVTPDLCRSLGAVYKGKSKYAGLPASRYTLDLGDVKNEPENHCFCEEPPDICPLKGTMNLAPCLENAPLIASMPHFLNGDDHLFENVEGLSPKDEKHLNIVDLERVSGMPFKAVKRIQFNLDQEPVKEVEPLANVRKMVMPLFWVEEGVAVNKTYVNMVRPIFIGKTFNQVTRWLSIIIGSLGCAGALYMHTQINSGSVKITNTTVTQNDKNNVSKNTVSPALTEKTDNHVSSNSEKNNTKNENNHLNANLSFDTEDGNQRY